MSQTIFTSRSKLALFAKAAEIRAGRLGTRGALMGLGYEPQSQSLLGPSEGDTTPSARLLDSSEPTYSQSLVDEEEFFTVDANLADSINSGTPYSSGNAPYSTSANRISQTTASRNVANSVDGSSSNVGAEVGNFLSSIFKGVVGVASGATRQPAPVRAPTTPSWVWWMVGGVAVVGGGGLLIAALSKKK